MITRYEPDARNVLGGPLQPCGLDPVTGFYRNGCCETGAEDMGLHTVCAIMTAEFLAYSRSVGNDLSTPMPAYRFAGLRPGDRWCLCAPRWKEALDAGAAPPVVLEATHEETLAVVDLKTLKAYASGADSGGGPV
ncbi:DUF2237 family protein [Phenylobacterium parvum]|uniref:DUF2237 domain-containing protein n=1 Tax=Phenylobacterium parvum TaxID=2201350 RepID=A0A2Z3HPU1_9CAUL|nr:DUF2237 domain-containing protein [Phenylobacterium parvum]AWM78393.1 DUF2237 domain-containing protein [Phenylobacterium parvum]